VRTLQQIFGEMKMIKRYLLIFISIVIGVVFFGSVLSPTIRITYLGPALGTIAGMYISWLIAAAVRENENLNKNDESSNDSQETKTTHEKLNTRCSHDIAIF
jgi:hypothetical protein